VGVGVDVGPAEVTYPPGVVRTTVVHVAGMDCPGEEQLVRMRLSRRPDVRQVVVDLDARTVTITHDSPPTSVLEPLDELGLGCRLVSDAEVPDAEVPDAEVSAPPGRGDAQGTRQRRGLLVALGVNACFFVAELVAGLVSGSMGLVADSLDMLADASVYALSLVAVDQAVARQKRLAASSGYLQLTLALVGLAEVVRRVATDEPAPDARTMVVVSALALAANVVVLVVLRRERGGAAHMRAAWIFTSNDVAVNALVIAAALLVWTTGTAAPDLVVGTLVFLIVANGARRILRLSR
jgi:copper chaperone CopZ